MRAAAIGAAATDQAASGGLSGGIVDFVRVSAGGLIVGVGLGWLVAEIIARVMDLSACAGLGWSPRRHQPGAGVEPAGRLCRS